MDNIGRKGNFRGKQERRKAKEDEETNEQMATTAQQSQI